MKMSEPLYKLSLAGLILFLTACSPAASTEPTVTPAQPATAAPTSTPLPAPTPSPTATVSPTATTAPLPSATPTETPAPPPTATAAGLSTADLEATIEAGLPPTSTPDADGFSMGGFDGVTVLPLTSSSSVSYWAVFTDGFRSFDPLTNHFVAIYIQADGRWQEVSRLELENPDYLDPAAVSQVEIEPDRIWLEVMGGAGAHSGSYDLLSFDGQTLRHDVTHFTSSPGGSRIEDLNEDGSPDVLLDLTEYYVFCYACGVRHIQYQVLSWDGKGLSEVSLTPLPATAPASLRDLTHRAVELAGAGLWRDAQETITQAVALDGQDPLVNWNAALIRLHAEERAEAREPYPLLGNVFYGDYEAALAVMRPYPVEEIFGQPTPLIDETAAMGWEPELSQWIIDSATLALQLQPDLAAAYFLRGWARHLTNPADPEALADIEQAARLDPAEALFAQSLVYLKR